MQRIITNYNYSSDKNSYLQIYKPDASDKELFMYRYVKNKVQLCM